MAQHNAAEKLLNKCLRSDDDEDDVQYQKSLDSNSISDLHDYCAANNFHKPEFTCTSACGPSHAPSFTFMCKLDSIERTATAGNKQLAKQLSAKAVFDILRASYPDIEKKVTVINESAKVEEISRHKATTYLELKKMNKADKMGTSIKDRHKFFRTQDEAFAEALVEILKASDLPGGEREKYDKLVEKLSTLWKTTTEQFLDTELMKFELEIDFEKFTCLLIGKEDELWRDVLAYFYDMLNIRLHEPVEARNGSPETVVFEKF